MKTIRLTSHSRRGRISIPVPPDFRQGEIEVVMKKIHSRATDRSSLWKSDFRKVSTWSVFRKPVQVKAWKIATF